MRKITAIILINILVASSLIYSQNECKVTYISNEGFLIENSGKKILVDALFETIEGNWCDSPSDTMVELMKNSSPPFDDIDIIAITHNHRDHFNESVVVNHMLSNKKGIVICPKKVGEILSKNPAFEKFSERIISVTPPLYSDTNIVVSNIPVRVLRFEHSHYMEKDSITGVEINRHRNVENIGYLFNINGVKIFHCGDTNPFNEKEYTTYSLNSEEVDIAFLERMFFSAGETGVKIINDDIMPENIILMHINPHNKSLFANHFKTDSTVTVFENKMESITLNFQE